MKISMSVSVEDKMIEQIKAIADEMDVSFSWVVNQAIKRYLLSPDKPVRRKKI